MNFREYLLDRISEHKNTLYDTKTELQVMLESREKKYKYKIQDARELISISYDVIEELEKLLAQYDLHHPLTDIDFETGNG